MGRHLQPLPASVAGRVFHVSEATDVPRLRTHGADLWSPRRGTRLPAGVTDFVSVCRAVALTLPDGAVISHMSAARLWGLPVRLSDTSQTRVHVTVPAGSRAPRGRSVIGHALRLSDGCIESHLGLSVTSPARTLLDVARSFSFVELVAIGDAVARMRGMGHIESTLAQTPRGSVPACLRSVLPRLTPAAESPKESEIRMILEDAGFGPFAVNYVVRDAWGNVQARVDLAIVELKIAVEYEGDYHREKNQWRRDTARRRRLEAMGWTYLSVTQADLDDPSNIIRDLRAAIDRAVARKT